MSSLEEQSTSMQCSADNSPPLTTTSKLRSLVKSKSLLERLSPPKSSRMGETGLLPGTELSEQSRSPSLTGECRNSQVTENTLSTCSQSLTPLSMDESLLLTKQCENVLGVSGTSNYPISRSLPTSRSHTWIRLGWQSAPGPRRVTRGREASMERIGRRTSPAINGMTENATKRKRIAGGNTCVTSAGRLDTKERSVERPLEEEPAPKRPRYLHWSIWADPDSPPFVSPTASSTLTDAPLPRPPPEEFDNTSAMLTIEQNAHLFHIVTPINVDRFEELLATHPNQPFVNSVCVSLREGFWPWAHMQKESYPVTWDFSDRPPKTECEADFLRAQRDAEIEAGRYSEGFRTNLLPGMYSTPVHAVPKPRSEKLRLVNDHSAGAYSLNSMILREDVVGARMDTVSNLVGALLRYHKEHPNTPLVMFKSDVSAAYRQLPLHPLWQIKQIVTIDGVRHVDRNTEFGGRGSCRDYTAFMGLVLWIAIFVKCLLDLFGYIDDNFSFEEEGKVTWYAPYQCYFPTKQARLLCLWDEIGLPHEKSKQEYAPVLRIIGFMVDPALMCVSMDDDDKDQLIQRISDFIATALGGTSRTLREFQQLAGWINWSFNVFPLLKPALSNVYAKISGKSESHAKVFVSKAVVRDLEWFIAHMKQSDGVLLFGDMEWGSHQADITAYSDACLTGLGFFFEHSCEGFPSQCLTPGHPPKDTIFFFEALAVVSVIDTVTRLPSIPARLLIYSDNSYTVDIFHSLRSLPPYNNLLKFAVTLLIKFNISLRVVHIPRVDNGVADALSCFDNTRALAACPGLIISSFQTPRVVLGEEK